MNYIYDIFLNYNDCLYEMFDWDKEDKITHIRKIPFLVVKSLDLFNFINKKVIFDFDFLSKLYQKTEVFNKKDIEYINYSFLATDKKELVAFKLDKMGKIKQYSKLLFSEEEEILDYSKILPFKTINYKITKSNKYNYFKTRNENKIKKFIYDELRKMKNDYNKLNFLYLECFGKTNEKDLLNTIYKQLDENWENVYFKLYNFLKKLIINK